MLSVVLCLSIVSFADNLNQYDIAARDFSFGDLSFAIRLSDFQRRHPGATLEKTSDVKAGFRHYRIIKTKGTADAVDIKFIDDKPLEITVFYTRERIDKLGGFSVMARTLVDRFGPADSDGSVTKTSDGEDRLDVSWTFREVERKIEFRALNAVGAVVVTHPERERDMTKRRSKTADLGF